MSLLKKLGMSLASFGLACAFNLEARLYAKDIYVPRDHATIQAAIDANDTVDGDRVLVAPGEYIISEPITYQGKNIILKSEGGPENTTICLEDPSILPWNYRSVIMFINNESGAKLDGFTITSGGNMTTRAFIGGGIYCNNSSPVIINSVIIGNRADHGGGIACFGADPLIISNVISRNIGGGEGGGVYCEDSQAQILDNIIKENSVRDMEGGGIYCCCKSSVIIKGNYIMDNFSREDGGGVHLGSSDAIIENNIIAGNTTNEDGGGISCVYAQANIIRNMIVKNSTYHWGGAIQSWDSQIYMFGNTIANNSGGTGGGIYSHGEANIVNSIIFGNTPDDTFNISPSRVFYSDIGDAGFAGINGNIYADPLFVNPDPNSNTIDNFIENGDYDGAMKYLGRCFSLQPNSPCIDSGDPGYLDQDGTRADIGAIYFDRRDIYRDGFIDFKDYGELSRNWQKTGSGLEGDIYEDDKVDYKDLKILAENWLSVVPLYGGYDD